MWHQVCREQFTGVGNPSADDALVQRLDALDRAGQVILAFAIRQPPDRASTV
jgi:hypothetical protein